LDVGEAIGDDEATSATERGDGTGVGEHGGDGLGDFAGIETIEVEDDADDIAGADIAGGIGTAEEREREGAEVLEGDEAELVAGIEEHDPAHGEDEVQGLDGLGEGVGIGVIVGEGAGDVGIGEEGFTGHLSEAFEDIGIGDAIELEPDIAEGGWGIGGWGGSRGLA
jgi:hypothetical protein